MIRQSSGTEFLLFTQDDHARLAGRLAAQLGNATFAAPNPREQVIDAISLHDCGWTLHDNAPIVDPQGLPLHVFDAPVHVAVKVWSESVHGAQRRGDYAALLVSLQVFALSALSYQHLADPADKRRNVKELFALNKFQQNQIEIQERIRRSLGLRTDMPLHLGIAPGHQGPQEDLLRFNFHLLKAMDVISLAVLCGGRPFSTIDEVYPRPDADPTELRLLYPSRWTVSVLPWPFAVNLIEIDVPYRSVPDQVYKADAALRLAHWTSPPRVQRVRVVRTGA